MTAEIRNSIIVLERDYAIAKEKFDKWKEEYAALSGQPSYNNYVNEFLKWEKTMMEKLSEQKRLLQTELASQSRVDTPPQRTTTSLPAQIPMVDMDTEVNELLQKITPAEFMAAMLTMGEKDKNFLPKVFEVIFEDFFL